MAYRLFIALIVSIITISTIPDHVKGQEHAKKGFLLPYTIENGDTVFLIQTRPVNIFYIDKNRKRSPQWREYYRLVYNFEKTYPFALIAKKEMMTTDSILKNSTMTKREEERFLKRMERELFAKFERPLRNLSFSQGRLLLRLLDRELGQTSYYVIKNYRGGFTAFFWQGIAGIFGADLKKPYDKFGEDKLTEELVLMYQDGSFYDLYYAIFGKK